MNLNEAYKGLSDTLADIAKIPTEAGLNANIACAFSDADGNRKEESAHPECLFGEITVGAEGAEEKVVFECAVGVFEGEDAPYVSDDELVEKISQLRCDVREFVRCVSESGKDSIKDAFVAAVGDECEDGADEAQPIAQRSNKSFYITAAIIAVAALIIFGIIRGLT